MRRGVRLAGPLEAAALAITVAACVAAPAPQVTPPRPAAYGAVFVETTPVALDPADARRTRVGQLTYLGGVSLRARDSSRLHGLSDVDVRFVPPPLPVPGRREVGFRAVSDEGDLFSWTALSEGPGRLAVGLAALRPLTDLAGAALQGKREADAEDMALTDDDGALYVAFERRHRVWRYAGAPNMLRAEAAPAPAVGLPENGGFEGLAILPLSGRRVLAVGAEDGRVWFCPLPPEQGCTLAFPSGGPAPGYRLTGLDHLAGTADLVATYRAYDPLRGMRTIVARLHTGVTGPRRSVEVLARLERPLVHGNFEGVAALENGRGGWTLYLVSDDGFPRGSPTLLLAFDYTPRAARPTS